MTPKMQGFVEKLAALCDEYDASLGYTTSDDGVTVWIGCENISIGYPDSGRDIIGYVTEHEGYVPAKQVTECSDPGRSIRMKAPWPDFAGGDIHEGDIIVHPASGETGRVIFRAEYKNPHDQWRVDYDTGYLARLCLQIGDKGQAVVAPSIFAKKEG